MRTAHPQTVLHRIIADSPELRPATKATYLRDLNQWIAFAGTEPANWTRYRAQEFYNAVLARGLKAQSANRMLATLRYAASWYARKEGDPRLDFADVQAAPNGDREHRAPLTPEETTALLTTCARGGTRDRRDFAMLVVLLETGMRRSSLTSMRLDETDVVGLERGYPATAVTLKGRQKRHPVPLSDTALAALRPWLADLARMRHTRGAVFCSVTSTLEGPVAGATELSEQSIYNVVGDRGRAAALRDLHPHLFRHSCVTWRIAAGTAPHIVSILTGHRLSGAALGHGDQRGDGLGAMDAYIDKVSPVMAEQARASTPPWLAALVSQLTR